MRILIKILDLLRKDKMRNLYIRKILNIDKNGRSYSEEKTFIFPSYCSFAQWTLSICCLAYLHVDGTRQKSKSGKWWLDNILLRRWSSELIDVGCWKTCQWQICLEICSAQRGLLARGDCVFIVTALKKKSEMASKLLWPYWWRILYWIFKLYVHFTQYVN